MLKSSKLILLCVLVLSGIISSFYPIHAFLDFSDSDQDGLSDELEISWGSDPFFNDTDNDGYFDFDEYEIGSNPTDWNDPEIIDHDFDGIADGKEFLIYKTN